MHKHYTNFLALMVVALMAAGCAAGMGEGRVGDPNMLTAEQIAESDARNAHDLIEKLRPRWLTQRFTRSERLSTGILVYQNQTRLGGLNVLRDIPIQGIYSIRYLDSAQAGQLPGAGSMAVDGAIVITTAAGRD